MRKKKIKKMKKKNPGKVKIYQIMKKMKILVMMTFQKKIVLKI